MLTSKRILVTGGAGFLGSHLCERLLAAGHEVLCVDNFYTGSKRHVAHLLDNPDFEVMRHDVTFPLYVEVDRIYNLACPASPVHYQFDPVQTTKTSVHGAINMLGLAKRVKARILQASTSEVYGNPEIHPQTEDYWGNVNPIGPRSCYDDETEILTEDGWVRFPDLREDARVATLEPDGSVSYHVPDEHLVLDYVGELLRFANSKMDLCVTPNHKLYVRSKTGKLRFLRADEQRHWPSWRVITGAAFPGRERDVFDPGVPPAHAKTRLTAVRMDDWLEFLGYYISEGCVHVRRRVRTVGGRDYDIADYNILIAQQDEAGRRKIAACLERLGWTYFDSDDHQFRICSKQLAELLVPLGKSADKYIPREYLRLPQRQARILLEALMMGDGSWKRELASGVYYTKSRQLADDVQELALRAGYAASKNLTPGRDLHRVNLRPPVEAKIPTPKRIPYRGKVYCVNVQNHVICVRRSGRVAWCGNCYDEGKRCAETLFFDYHRQHNLEIKVVRIFNTYGPRMHPNDGRVVSNFIMQALRGEDITIYGDGSQTRSFCYVDDLISGFTAMMETAAEFTGPVNLGNPDERTIRELAEQVIDITGSKSKLVQKPLPTDDPTRRKPDITLARKKLSWEPSVSLRAGLEKTVAYFDGLLRGAR